MKATRTCLGLDDPILGKLRELVADGDTIVWGQADGQPRRLTRVLAQGRHAWRRLGIFLGIGSVDMLQPAHADVLELISYCGTGSNRALAKAGVLDILPSHYAQFPRLMRCGGLRVDVVMLRVSPPDDHGNYSLGLSNDYLCAAVEAASVVIAEVDPSVPWTYGEFSLRREDFDLLIDADTAAAQGGMDDAASASGTDTVDGAIGEGAGNTKAIHVSDPVDAAIGRHVASLVEDGATLQVGIGRLPEAILRALHGHRHLGFHSGAAGDGLVDLVECGALTNARKPVDTGISVAGMLMGTRRLHRYAHCNPGLRLRASTYTHALAVLASLPRFVALNSAIEVDLEGRVNSEIAGGVYVGAIGGATDFLRGAHASEGGMPIVALAASARGRSNIVHTLQGPASVSAADAGVVVTEHGVADLRGQPYAERRRRLIRIAAPEHREELERLSRLGR